MGILQARILEWVAIPSSLGLLGEIEMYRIDPTLKDLISEGEGGLCVPWEPVGWYLQPQYLAQCLVLYRH